jgi:hypothetical protein
MEVTMTPTAPLMRPAADAALHRASPAGVRAASRRLMDAFGDSLVFTNSLLNSAFKR